MNRATHPPHPDRRAARSFALVLLSSVLCWNTPARAEDAFLDQPADIRKMIAEGQGDALAHRFREGRNPAEWQMLVEAYSNQAARAPDADQQERAFLRAERFCERWINELRLSAQKEDPGPRVDAAYAHVTFGNLLLGRRAAPLLDEWELTGGLGGAPAGLAELLTRAEEQYRVAQQLVQPLAAQMNDRAEEFQIAGIYDRLRQAALDAQFNLGWSGLYLARLHAHDNAELARLKAQAAEREFSSLLTSGKVDAAAIANCRLGLAMAQRAAGKYDIAEREFGRALSDAADARFRAQVQYELARCQLDADRFSAARQTLAELHGKDWTNLADADEPIRFYVALAKLWTAKTYLLEANALERAPTASNRQRAQQARQEGVVLLNRLRELGGRWPELVRLHLGAHVDPRTDPARLGTAELLIAANALYAEGHAAEARARLQAALLRSDLDPIARLDALVLLGRVHYESGDFGAAAQVFEEAAFNFGYHARAEQAATYAYQLRAEAARTGQRPEDFARLAELIGRIQSRFPKHPDGAELRWLLPESLQRAGKYAEAVRAFGQIPADDPRAEEARYQQVNCSRILAEQAPESLSSADRQARLRTAAAMLDEYSDQALQRAAAGAAGDETRKWSAEARLEAARLLLDPPVFDAGAALELLTGFEADYGRGPALGRALGLQIRAYRARNEFTTAAELIQQYLKSASAEEAQPVLAELAQGMLTQVRKLRAAGDDAGATALAQDAGKTLAQLEAALPEAATDDPRRTTVRIWRATALFYAGETAAARALVSELRAAQPDDGALALLYTQIRSAELSAAAPRAELESLRAEWGKLLRDPELRVRAPEVYWEARYEFLALTLRLGFAPEVVKAIRNDRAWYPDLGGPRWKPKFEALLRRAEAARP